MDKLELKHLTPYLPYKLLLQYKDFIYEVNRTAYLTAIGTECVETTYKRKIKGCSGDNIGWEGHNNVFDLGVKPILRPLSDLFKPIDWNNDGELTMIGYKYGVEKVTEDGELIYAQEYYADYCESPKAYIDITCINWWLFEYHFDVFGLIEKGLAIDINTLK